MKHFSLMDRPQSHSDLSASHLKLRLGFLPVNALLNAFAAMTIKLHVCGRTNIEEQLTN